MEHKVSLVKVCQNDGHICFEAKKFVGHHREYDRLLCDWCAWMWGCDCHPTCKNFGLKERKMCGCR